MDKQEYLVKVAEAAFADELEKIGVNIKGIPAAALAGLKNMALKAGQAKSIVAAKAGVQNIIGKMAKGKEAMSGSFLSLKRGVSATAKGQPKNRASSDYVRWMDRGENLKKGIPAAATIAGSLGLAGTAGAVLYKRMHGGKNIEQKA